MAAMEIPCGACGAVWRVLRRWRQGALAMEYELEVFDGRARALVAPLERCPGCGTAIDFAALRAELARRARLASRLPLPRDESAAGDGVVAGGRQQAPAAAGLGVP